MRNTSRTKEKEERKSDRTKERKGQGHPAMENERSNKQKKDIQKYIKKERFVLRRITRSRTTNKKSKKKHKRRTTKTNERKKKNI